MRLFGSNPVESLMERVIALPLVTILSVDWLMVSSSLLDHTYSSFYLFPILMPTLTAFKPAPQAGQWNEAYFEMLIKNAVPALA
jgi:hypothetical protein